MAVKAGQSQVQCDTQVSTRTYVTTATGQRSKILQLVSNYCGECADSSALNEHAGSE